jgi:DNA-binding response OmpR family regulator
MAMDQRIDEGEIEIQLRRVKQMAIEQETEVQTGHQLEHQTGHQTDNPRRPQTGNLHPHQTGHQAFLLRQPGRVRVRLEAAAARWAEVMAEEAEVVAVVVEGAKKITRS